MEISLTCHVTEGQNSDSFWQGTEQKILLAGIGISLAFKEAIIKMFCMFIYAGALMDCTLPGLSFLLR